MSRATMIPLSSGLHSSQDASDIGPADRAGYLLLAVCWKVSVAREKVEARFMVVLEFEMTLVAIAAVALEVGGLLLRCGLRGCGGGGGGKLKKA